MSDEEFKERLSRLFTAYFYKGEMGQTEYLIELERLALAKANMKSWQEAKPV